MTDVNDHSSWTFLTHHARVLLEIARDPEVLLREVAQRIGITERAVQGIVSDLHEAGYLTRERVGRRNHYELNLDRSFRYPTEAHAPVRALVELFATFESDMPPADTASRRIGRTPGRRRVRSGAVNAPGGRQMSRDHSAEVRSVECQQAYQTDTGSH